MRYGKLALLTLLGGLISANAGTIEQVNYGKDASGNTEIQFLGHNISNIASFNMTNPSMIVIDFLGTDSALDFRDLSVKSGLIDNVVVLEGAGKTRATINLSNNIKYEVINSDNVVSVVFPKNVKTGAIKSKSVASASPKVNFSRGVNGQGVITIASVGKGTVDLNTEGRSVLARLRGVKIGKGQIRRMNVKDFGTPVSFIDVYSGRLNIRALSDDFEVTSYQNGDSTVIEFSKPEVEDNPYEKEMIFSAKKDYKGTPMSLNFQQIDVRAVIQLVADYTNRNIVVSDEVTGNITLRLNEVPSDQVLETILKTKGLSMREVSGVTYIAPTTTLVTQETTELEGMRKREELSPLRTEMITVNYARAEAIAKVIEEAGRGTGDEKNRRSGFLSSRGSISVDPRTNSILIQDVASKITEIRAQIAELDVAVNQVLISSRLVSASDSFMHELGVRLGGSFVTRNGANGAIGTTGSIAGANNLVSSALKNTVETGQPFPVSPANLGQRLGVNLPASNPTGAIGIGILGADYLIDLELSAMNEEGRGEVISSQKLMTQDGAAANIEQGSEIPYSVIDDNGKVQTTFKPVVMKLDVTPKITPNKMVDMIIDLSKDTVGTFYKDVPSINKSKLSTQVLVENGETVVLGGVYEQTRNKSQSKVPLLGDLPAVGRLFRKDANSYKKEELLIFVTPQIVDKRFVSGDKFSNIRN